jgi:hypothetical protein
MGEITKAEIEIRANRAVLSVTLNEGDKQKYERQKGV